MTVKRKAETLGGEKECKNLPVNTGHCGVVEMEFLNREIEGVLSFKEKWFLSLTSFTALPEVDLTC